MKKITTIVLATVFLLACNMGNEKEKTTAAEPAVGNHTEHTKQVTGLVLNNDAKWKADLATVENVALLQKIASGAKKESLENYLQTAAALEDGLNKMVRDCKMQGADHKALHHWLEPIMEKTTALKNANSIENAVTISGEIENQINLFPQYFE